VIVRINACLHTHTHKHTIYIHTHYIYTLHPEVKMITSGGLYIDRYVRERPRKTTAWLHIL